MNTLGFCAGGILMTTVLNHLAATGDDSVHSAAYAVTLLDFATRARSAPSPSAHGGRRPAVVAHPRA